MKRHLFAGLGAAFIGCSPTVEGPFIAPPPQGGPVFAFPYAPPPAANVSRPKYSQIQACSGPCDGFGPPPGLMVWQLAAGATLTFDRRSEQPVDFVVLSGSVGAARTDVSKAKLVAVGGGSGPTDVLSAYEGASFWGGGFVMTASAPSEVVVITGPASPGGPWERRPTGSVASIRTVDFSGPRAQREGLDVAFAFEDEAGPPSALELLWLRAQKPIVSHVHPNEDEYWVLLSGSGLYAEGGRNRPLATGDCLTIPRGREHSFVPREATSILQVFRPGGPERALR